MILTELRDKKNLLLLSCCVVVTNDTASTNDIMLYLWSES